MCGNDWRAKESRQEEDDSLHVTYTFVTNHVLRWASEVRGAQGCYKLVGCGSDRHRESLTRAFKLNMGWGEATPEWTNAESVWFGLTASFQQVRYPGWTIKRAIHVPGMRHIPGAQPLIPKPLSIPHGSVIATVA